MGAGQYRHRIAIQRQQLIAGDRGQNVGLWETIYDNVPASVISDGGDLSEYAHTQMPIMRYVVKTRWAPDIDISCQIIWYDGCKNRTLGIVQPPQAGGRAMDGRHIYLTFTCEEVRGNE